MYIGVSPAVSAPHVCNAQEGQKRASNLFGTVVTQELNLEPLQSNKCSFFSPLSFLFASYKKKYK